MTLYLVRHGQSEQNADHSLSLEDPRLTSLGHEQSRLVGAYLSQFSPVYVLSSPLQRAKETAEHLDLPVTEWLVLIEGDWNQKQDSLRAQLVIARLCWRTENIVVISHSIFMYHILTHLGYRGGPFHHWNTGITTLEGKNIVTINQTPHLKERTE